MHSLPIKNRLNEIKKNSRFLAHITIQLSNGDIVDSTKPLNKPTYLQMGDGSFSSEFESYLYHKTQGETVTFTLPPEHAFGMPLPEQIHWMKRESFAKKMNLNEGNIIRFDSMNGQSLPGIITAIKKDSVQVDFNPPLAGKTITFIIEILQIKSKTMDMKLSNKDDSL
jgi:FKBP-type peptidyl-prolyl cis-trans isomerase SlpA